MAKIRERKTRDVDQVKCIKDEADQILVKEEKIKHRWPEYFDKLFNGKNKSSTIELESEIKEDLKMMKGVKTNGP
jgi:hypothetical protein